MTLLQPNRMPQKLNRLLSNLYARRLTLVRTLASFCERPSGGGLRRFFVLPFGLPWISVAGTLSKYGSCGCISKVLNERWRARLTSFPKLFFTLSPRIFLLTNFASIAAIAISRCFGCGDNRVCMNETSSEYACSKVWEMLSTFCRII